MSALPTRQVVLIESGIECLINEQDFDSDFHAAPPEPEPKPRRKVNKRSKER